MKTLIRKFSVLVALAALATGAFGQAPAPAQCYSGSQVIQPCTILTDAVYWAAKDSRIHDLQKLVTPDGLPDQAGRQSAAAALDAAGLVIDRQIDIWGWDPVLVMNMRGAYGFAWAPNAFQPNFASGNATPTDMSKPWPRSIRTSTLASDYPPIQPPAPVAAPSDGVTWYFDAASGTYQVLAAAVTGPDGKYIYAEGQQLLYAGQTVYFHVSYGIFGGSPQFVLKKP